MNGEQIDRRKETGNFWISDIWRVRSPGAFRPVAYCVGQPDTMWQMMALWSILGKFLVNANWVMGRLRLILSGDYISQSRHVVSARGPHLTRGYFHRFCLQIWLKCRRWVESDQFGPLFWRNSSRWSFKLPIKIPSRPLELRNKLAKMGYTERDTITAHEVMLPLY